MQQDTKTYKVVRRGQKWGVRVRGNLNTTDTFGWCRERNMSYHIKKHYPAPYSWENWSKYEQRWDYTFIFDQKKEALTFILGYL